MCIILPIDSSGCPLGELDLGLFGAGGCWFILCARIAGVWAMDEWSWFVAMSRD